MNEQQEKVREIIREKAGYLEFFEQKNGNYVSIMGQNPSILSGDYLGEINEDGSVLLDFPDYCDGNPNSPRIRNILTIKEILNKEGLPYKTNRPKEDVAKEIEKGLESIKKNLVSRILE